MKNITLVTVLTFLLMTGCVSTPKVQESNVKTYTQVGMWYLNKGDNVNINGSKTDVLSTNKKLIYADKTIPAVNYSRDVFIPVNSIVTLMDEKNEDVVLLQYDGKIISLENRKSYTGLSEDGLINRMFGATPVDLSYFSDAERELIHSGKVKLGMSKESIILSRGYPPKHRTASLNSDVWRYWLNRFDSRNFIFKDNILVEFSD